MYDGYLSFEDGILTLGGERIEGVLKESRIHGAVRFDEAEQDGLSGKVKTPMGWEDADISFAYELLSDDYSTCYGKLSQINAIFRGTDNGANPKIYDIANAHMQARGIDQVVFSGLESQESDQEDTLLVYLWFVEHNPPIQRVEKRVVTIDTAAGGTSGSTTTGAPPASTGATTNPALSDKIMGSVE